MLKDIQDKRCHGRINFRFAWDETLHDRLIRADNGWTILLGRGLGIFQEGSGRRYDLAARYDEVRPVVTFGVSYIRGQTEH